MWFKILSNQNQSNLQINNIENLWVNLRSSESTSKNWKHYRYLLQLQRKVLCLKMFFPQTSVPKKSDVQDQISKVYPGAKLLTFKVSEYEPGQPLLHTSKEQHGQKKQERIKKEDLTKKDESLTKERIQEATLRHQARRLEIPAGHHSALE